jgi:TonB family protein
MRDLQTGRRIEGDPLHLILELESEVERWRMRAVFLLSVFLHALLVIFLLVEPKLFRELAAALGINTVAVAPEPKRETTFLYLPPDLQKSLREPHTNILSDKNRNAQGRSPIIDPNGIHAPYLQGNTKLPEVPGGGKPTPPAAAPTPPPGGGQQPQQQASANPPGKQGENPPKEEPKLALNDVGADGGGGQLHLPLTTPGEAIQQSLAAAARGRGSGGAAGPGDSTGMFQNVNPNFSVEGPVILSDTQGVDFGPYLARIVFITKRNWYSVMPEAARLGQKGRVSIVFEILKDGSVPQMNLVAGSGAEALDRAALAAIRASIPFPPLPTEFTGRHLVLQFIFLYNIGYGQ